jgi:MFS family permease
VTSNQPAPDSSNASAWAPLRVPVFRALWLAMLTSNIGTWAHDVGAAWLMTSLTTSPLWVSLLQTAASVPVLMLALPAGSLADVVSRRSLLIASNLAMAVVAALLAAVTVWGVMSPELLLTFTFALGLGTAFGNPAWQATIPELVPRPLVSSATTLGGVSVNLARAVGPALGGVIVAIAGPPAVFVLNAVATFVIVAVVWRWRPAPAPAPAPAEHLIGAMRAGLRFVRHSEQIRPVLVRALAFIVCGSALWALLPVLGRQQLGLDAAQYGLLLGAVGTGAVTASNFLPAWRQRLNVDRLVVVASLALAALLALLSIIRSYPLTLAAMFVIGMAWIALMPTFNVAAIQALPSRVRARGLAIYNVIFMGGTAMGGVLWGTVATAVGVPAALLLAAGGLTASVLIAPWFPMRRVEDVDLSPAGHWPTLETITQVAEPDAGPVLITVEYRIDPLQRDEFLRLVHATRPARLRDGGYAWGIYQDADDPSRYIESFLVESWSEHQRQHARVTKHDQAQEALARALHVGPEPPIVRHYLNAVTSRRGETNA